MPDISSQLQQALYPFLTGLARIVIILVAAFVISRLARRFIRGLHARLVRVMARHAAGEAQELEKRAATIGAMLRKTVGVLIWALAIVIALREVGFDITPILAGAGVVGLAVGFGAQNLVRDVISGLFMLLENQIRVNDVAIINGTSGLVEEINMRTTVLRSADGTVHIFPNGAITSLSNMTREYSYYMFNIGVAYREDTDRVVAVIKDVADTLAKEPEFAEIILSPIEIFGVDQFADSAVIIKARIKTLPNKQWMVGREINRRIKIRFDELGIEIPFPHQSLYFGEASKPIRVQLEKPAQEELRRIVREVLSEMQAPQGGPQETC
ncbi:MAG: mechanosensitive ion channel family protein [Acidobacteria bacterium]|nr:mechanosensitive ion channel family protein [Acidobacteriota bacterium]